MHHRNRPRILALCGARSNDDVAKLQLENIQITGNVCDIVYLHGDIEVEEEDSELYGIVNGPFFSWFDPNDDTHRLNESIVKSVRLVLNFLAEHGPFDGVYGFSNGGLIAALVAGIADDSVLRGRVNQQERGLNHWGSIFSQLFATRQTDEEVEPGQIDRVFDLIDTHRSGLLTADDLADGLATVGVNATKQDAEAMVSVAAGSNQNQFVDRRAFHSMCTREVVMNLAQSGHSLSEECSVQDMLLDPPFKYIVCGCAAFSRSKGIVDSITCTKRFTPGHEIGNVKSIHLIGVEDPLKSQSEELLRMFAVENTRVFYMPGGHAIGREVGHDDVLCSTIKEYVKTGGSPSHVPLLSDFRVTSAVSSLAAHPTHQIARVQVNASLMPGSNDSNDATIIACLAAQSDSRPFIYNARENGGIKRSPSDHTLSTHVSGETRLRSSRSFSLRSSIKRSVSKLHLSSRSSVEQTNGQPLSTPSKGSKMHRSSSMSDLSQVAVGASSKAGSSGQPLPTVSGGSKMHSSSSMSDLSQVAIGTSSKEGSSNQTPPASASGQDDRFAQGPFASAAKSQLERVDELKPDDDELSQLTPFDTVSSSFISVGLAIDEGIQLEEDPARLSTSRRTTYGDALQFILHGEGDLRRIGVKAGEVVAYVAPGASSLASDSYYHRMYQLSRIFAIRQALAFLTFAAQTVAAPLSPGMEEPDALDALHQFNAKHLILFDGVECEGVESAFRQYSDEGNGIIHRANTVGSPSPGLFKFDRQIDSYRMNPPLQNPANGIALLLRTSGTTSRPKCVPLRQQDLVRNGATIAHSMQLTDNDVCYSVMPLFHIGGLSASVLCTMTSGGALCCEPEPYEPSRMIDALALSSPQPTWYSAVPTIHNATANHIRDPSNRKEPTFARYGIKRGKWNSGHSLRMIRSGAAALTVPDASALSAAFGQVPIYPTYSMSEQMPITQPPAGDSDIITERPGSVGVPIAASVVIVSRANYRPLPYGEEGEIAICGDTVIKNYLDNPGADAKSFFYLISPDSGNDRNSCRYFLTGDVGRLDKDGYLYISGRAKELIKRGGEQVSPYEVEEVLSEHPWLETPLCFGVPSKVYGEEVGCALVLSTSAPASVEKNEVIKALRKLLKEKQLAPYKWPTKWVVVEEKDLPRTATKKLVRVNAASAFGLIGDEDDAALKNDGVKTRATIDWEVISGFRFLLACYVMFMHIGSSQSWGRMNALRGFPWHVHTFFLLGGFSLASPMNPSITKKLSYVTKRIAHMYPAYALALVFGLANLLVVCRPSTFRQEFHWDSQPDDLYQPDGTLSPLFCEGTPLFQTSYWASLISTIVIYIAGLAVTPFYPANWWLGYYLWFSSMFYQCITIFPLIYNYLYNSARKRKALLLKIMAILQLLNAIVITAAWLLMRDGEGYNHFDNESGEENDEMHHSNGVYQNVAVLSFYLTAPFWAFYFVIGAVLAFIYDAFKPANKHRARMWGYVADSCTMVTIIISIALVCDNKQTLGQYPEPKMFRPAAADQFTDAASAYRLWDNLSGRIMAPLTSLWIYALSTGRGYTAMLLRHPFLVSTLSPLSYNCFLFHQVVAQWYFAATRDGHFWNWWRYRKQFYWFSPEPCPVDWFEYFYVVGIVCFFSNFVDSSLLPAAKRVHTKLMVSVRNTSKEEEEEEVDVHTIVCNVIENMTGIEPEADSTLDEVGLASVGIPVIVGLLNDAFSKTSEPLGVTGQDLIKAKTIRDIVGVVESAKERMQHDGV